ncbi:phosphoserine phosphatase protein [Rutstroemia sp. NJR-2017a BBW]|nr:phosphoserine phosphatase protein [Rutstroemia sp. NJR-2017a BBW]
MGSISNLPAMKNSPKYIFFTDFDGTITTRDSNDFLTDNLGFGQVLRKQGNQDVLHDRKSFRDSFQEMMDSVKTPYDKCIQTLLENIKLDPYFKEFIDWANENNVPVVVLSSGMEPIIRALLEHMVGKDAAKVIQIVSNDVEVREGHKSINEEGGWKIVFHDESHFGHDKSREIRPYANLPENQRPTMFYAGDGVSDLSAAKETDLLFAKKGQDLVAYCVREKVPFTIFEDWSSILSTVKDIVAGKTTVKDVYAAGVEDFKQGGNEK